ncbi:hypothetical protein I4U23_017245 [Adineta vaga]|nr:hypothetical protein I4U23_017245 [Adineta vaga]
MASSTEKIGTLKAQCDELTEIATKLNTTINDAITTASNELKVILNKVNETIDDIMSTVTNDTNEWKQLKINLETTKVQGKIILDVGGKEFPVSTTTLRTEENTFFTTLLSEQWEIEKDKDGRIFIDRDGKLFEEILKYMRNPTRYVLVDEKIRYDLMVEAEFYRLDQLFSLISYFSKSSLLNFEQQIKLNEFYGKRDQIWNLIYKATNDGFEATTFHNLCNNQGPTMTIIKSTDGFLFGGYISQHWTSAGTYTNAPNSFLFFLKNANGNSPTKFIYNNNGNAFYNNASYGPTFGSGHDLYIVNLSNTNKSTCSLGASYPNSLNLGANTFTGSNQFLVAEIEVFKLS